VVLSLVIGLWSLPRFRRPDLAAVQVAALKHCRAATERGAFSLGTGAGYSVGQILDAVRKGALSRALGHLRTTGR
jgi:UDP-glucose 4-epimerase